MTTDLRTIEMREFHASEGNTFADHALRCAVDGKVLLTKRQAQAVEDHLDCVGASLDALLWGYSGRYYEIDGGYIYLNDVTGESDQGYWLTSSPFDPYLPAPDGSDEVSDCDVDEDLQLEWEADEVAANSDDIPF
jgi:hypothetical protein